MFIHYGGAWGIFLLLNMASVYLYVPNLIGACEVCSCICKIILRLKATVCICVLRWNDP